MSDDTEVTGKIISLRGLDAGDVGAKVGEAAVAFFREPENLAAITGATLLPVIVFRGHRPPLLPWLLVALMGDRIGRMTYRASRDLQTIAKAAATDA